MNKNLCLFTLWLDIYIIVSGDQGITSQIMTIIASNYQLLGKLVEKSLRNGERACSFR